MKERHFILNNGVKIPAIGFGTWQIPDGTAAVEAIHHALEAGYRHIDTAAIYKNEKGIGQAIKESDIDRDQIFVTSKVWNTERGYQKTMAAFQKTLLDLQLDYLDLYLIHWPASANQYNNWQELNRDTWMAMEELYGKGKIKAIGVSNFMPHHLEPLLESANVLPAINQIEYHPGLRQVECVDFCVSNNILVEGWAPLGTGRVLDHPTLIEIAHRYDKSVAQLCIRWVWQNGILPLPKSSHPGRIRENIAVDDFEISDTDVAMINQLEEFGGSGQHPDRIAF